MFAFIFKVWGLARRYRGRLILGIITGIIAGLMEPLMIGTAGLVYAIVFPEANSEVPGKNGLTLLMQKFHWAPEFVQNWIEQVQKAFINSKLASPGQIAALVALIPTVIFLRGLFSYLNVYFLNWAANRTIADLRVKLFSHLTNLSTRFFSQSNSGELMSRVTSDTSQLHGILSSATAVIVKDPVTLVSLLALLLWQQRAITLISIVVMPICMVPIVIYNRKLRKSSKALQAHAAELAKVMSEAFTGIRVIKAYNLESTVVEQFRATAMKLVGHYMRIVRSAEIPGPLLEFAGSIGLTLVFLYLMFRPGLRPSAGDFIVVIGSLFSMYRPLKSITRLYNSIEQARASSERVFELLATPNDIVESANPVPLRAAGAPIQFDGISFSYGNTQVLHNIQLTVKPGQLVALVGKTGSGKSTLTNLLMRFYDPQQGAIRVGGVDIRNVSSRDLRGQIALVTQETILFNDTIRNNIALGRPGATQAEIEAAAEHAHATEFILQQEQGYDTEVGEKGIKVSGGQRQRLAIARAILKDAPILILDEATNALDAEVQRMVQDALEELMQGRTSICIAHRLSTIQKADVIVVLEQGRIVEMGTHNELLKARGKYFDLHNLEFQQIGD